MIGRPPRSTLTDTLFPHTTPVRSPTAGRPLRRRRGHGIAHQRAARAHGAGGWGSRGVNPPAPRPPSLIRRCAIGIWLCGIALLGVVEFRRYSMAGGEFSMTPVAWMWLVGSIITGAVGIALLVRELLLHR